MSARGLVAALLLVLPVALTGCPTAPACVDNAGCGDLEACVEGKCKEVDCLQSSDCEMEHFCLQDEWTCEPGCEFNTDCYVADRCEPETLQCVTRSCRDSQLDCPAGHRCNTQTGACYLDPAPHCASCSGSAECGSEGGCYRFSENTSAAYCFMSCNPEAVESCPAGFSCSGTSDDKYVCVGYCPLM